MDDVLLSVNTAIGIMKKIKEVNSKIRDADIKMLIADLSIEIANTKTSIAELLDENRNLKDKIKQFEEEKNKKKMVFKNNAYYEENGDGPFCPACFDSKKEKIRLVDNVKDFVDIAGKYKCPVCGTMIKG